MRIVFVTTYFVVSLVLLMLTFRIDEYLRNSMLSKTSTIVSYLILALLLTIVAAYLAPWAAHLLFPKLSKGSWAGVIAIAGITFALFCVISALFGPVGLDLPGTRIRGVFFSEWKFTNFIFYDAVLLALFSGVLRRFGKY
jgi:hypothetical protein